MLLSIFNNDMQWRNLQDWQQFAGMSVVWWLDSILATDDISSIWANFRCRISFVSNAIQALGNKMSDLPHYKLTDYCIWRDGETSSAENVANFVHRPLSNSDVWNRFASEDTNDRDLCKKYSLFYSPLELKDKAALIIRFIAYLL